MCNKEVDDINQKRKENILKIKLFPTRSRIKTSKQTSKSLKLIG